LTITPNDPWYSCLPSCETQVPCGQGQHIVRGEAGQLRLPEHPDAEAELVLAALGGEKAGCVVLAEAWGRHTSDLSVLAVGPRGPADAVVVSWEDVEAAAQAGQRGGAVAFSSSLRRRPLRRPAGPPAAAVGHGTRQRQIQQEIERIAERRNDMLSLHALGYGFAVRLAGQVAAAHADSADATPTTARPALVSAITGRLALIAEQWLGIDPDQVVVSLHDGPGWGRSELTGKGSERRLRVSLPASWLARVWACGLALTARHLVVAVDRAGWPDARVLALRVPGAEPVLLDVHARPQDGRDGPADAPHWEV
jgi:hypothetical protein